MADNIIPLNDPGIAGFATESWQSAEEPRYGEGVPTTTHKTVTSAAAATFKLYAVVHIAANGAITMAEHDGTASDANAILAAPAAFTAGQSMSLPFYREGHWSMDGLVWDASFDTDAKKAAAFEGSTSPTIFVSKKLFTNAAIDI